MEFWESNNIHPITGFKTYANVELKKYNDKNYKPKTKYTEDIEEGVDKKSGMYRAVYRFGTKVVKKIVLGKYEKIDDARKKYNEYLEIKPKNKGVYFSRNRYKFYFKHKGNVIWAKVREGEDEFLARMSDLYNK